MIDYALSKKFQWWIPCTEPTGTRHDVTGSGNHFLDINTVTQGEGLAYNFNSSAQFTKANSEWLRLPNNAGTSVNNESFFVCGWLSLTTTPSDLVYFGGQYNGENSANRSWILSCQNRSIGFEICKSGISSSAVYLSMNHNTNNFFCFEHIQGSGVRGCMNNGPMSTTVATGGINPSVFDIGIGTVNSSSGPASAYGFYVNGRVGPIGFGKGQITREEIGVLYNNGLGRKYPFIKDEPLFIENKYLNNINPIAYYKLNETSGNRADSSINGLTLTDTNTVTSTVGKLDRAASFVASNNEYLTSNSTLFNPETSDFAVSFWVYILSLSNPRILVGKGASSNGASTAEGFYVGVDSNGGGLLGFSDGNSTRIAYDGSTGQFVINTWYWICVNFDRDGNMELFRNNVSIATVSISAQQNSCDPSALFTVGAQSINGGGHSFVHWGYIDEVLFQKQLLNSTTRELLYRQGTPPPFEYFTNTPIILSESNEIIMEG